MSEETCKHEWIVTVDNDNFPEDVMCRKCKEVVIMVDRETNKDDRSGGDKI